MIEQIDARIAELKQRVKGLEADAKGTVMPSQQININSALLELIGRIEELQYIKCIIPAVEDKRVPLCAVGAGNKVRFGSGNVAIVSNLRKFGVKSERIYTYLESEDNTNIGLSFKVQQNPQSLVEVLD